MRILVCDQHAMFGEAFGSLLMSRGHEVAGRTASVADALEFIRDGEWEPEVVVLDLDLPGTRHESAVGSLRRAAPDVAIAVLTGNTDVPGLCQALDDGADGVALKFESVDEVERLLFQITSTVFTKLRTTGQPEKVWSRRARALADQMARARMDDLPTPRERQVIELLARGESTAGIARIMGVGTATVRTHLQHLFIKLGIHSRLELVAFAVREGLVDGLVGVGAGTEQP